MIHSRNMGSLQRLTLFLSTCNMEDVSKKTGHFDFGILNDLESTVSLNAFLSMLFPVVRPRFRLCVKFLPLQ